MTVPTLAEIEAAKVSMDDINSFTYLPGDSFVDGKGTTRDTVNGRLKKMGYDTPIDYVVSILFTVSDNLKTVDEDGIIYAPKPSALPFTTSGTFIGDDDARFFVVQGVNSISTEIVYSFDTKALMISSNIVFVDGKRVRTKGDISIGDGGGLDYIIKSSIGAEATDGLRNVLLSTGKFAQNDKNLFILRSPSNAGFAPNEIKTLFMNPLEYEAANASPALGVTNQFHFFHTGTDVRMEFECENSDAQFYIEGGVGKDAWYGLQEGGTHHWSHGSDVSDSATYKFCEGFGLFDGTARFLIRKSGTVATLFGNTTIPSYGFIGDNDTGMFRPAADNIGLVTNGVEQLRIGSTGRILMKSLGIAASPVLSWLDDPDTGIFNPGSDAVGIITGGVERTRVNSLGELIIQTNGKGISFKSPDGNITKKLTIDNAGNPVWS